MRPLSPVRYVERDRGHTTPCWVWQRTIGPNGYGRIGRCAAHRWYYERQVGPIPDGLDLDHLCRVRECVNPDHMEPVTRAENLRRGLGTKLTAANVRAIRANNESAREAAARYGVSEWSIYKIRQGIRWVDLDQDTAA